MHFTELAAQGVRDFSATTRCSFRSGYLVLKPNGAGTPPVASLLCALLFPDGRGTDVALKAAPDKPAKAALLLVGDDQVTYRAVRELGGSGGLFKLDRATNQFVAITQDAQEIIQLLRSSALGVSRTAFEHLFCFTSAQLPSRRPADRGSSGGKIRALGEALLDSSDGTSGGDRVKQLTEELAASKEVGKVQFQMDEVTAQVFEAEQKLKGLSGLKDQLAEAERALQSAPTVASLGLADDIIERAQTYPQLVARRDEALAKLNLQPAEAAPIAPVAAGTALARDTRFWAALGGGVALLVGGLIGKAVADPAWGYVAVLDVVPFGLAALLAIKRVDEWDEASRSSRKVGMATAREQKVLQEFEAKAGPVRRALKSAGVETPEELLELLSRRAALEQRVEGARAQLAEAEGSPEIAQATEQLEALREKQKALNDDLLQRGYVREAREIEKELARLREGRSTPGASTSGGADKARPLQDPCPLLLKAATDVLGGDVAAVAGMVRDRALQYLAALTDKRYVGLELDKEGRATVAAGGKKVPVTELPPRDLDLVYLSIRLTVLEKYAAKGKVPAVFEEGFAPLEAAKVPLLARMLKHLGTLTQVLHVTGEPAYAGVADAGGSL